MKRIYSILGVFLLVSSFQTGALAKGDDVIVQEITGYVQIQRLNESDWVPAQENDVLTSGDQIRSFLKSSALLVFPDNSEFRLRENTSLDIKDVSANVKSKTAKRELKLNLGSLHYKVPPKKEKASEFKIHSSTSIVGITGTEGVVTSKGDGKPSENILIEGSTYNTNDQGQAGRFQTKGNIYVHDGASPQIFAAEVDQEASDRMAINDEYLNLIQDVVAAYKKKKDEGYRVDVVEIMIKQAFFFLEKRDYDQVKQMVARGEALLEDANKIVVPPPIQKKVTDLHEAIKLKESEGYDTSKIYALFENIRTLMQNGYFKEVNQEVTSLQQKLGLLTQAEEEINFETYYKDVQLKVIEKEKKGYALGEIKSMLRQSRIFFDQNDKPKAYQLLDNIEKRLALVLRNVSDTLQKSLQRLEKEIADKKAQNYPTKELELRLDEAKVFIKEEDFLSARELMADIETLLLTLSKGVSVEWQLKIKDIKEEAAYKESMGYDINPIKGDLGQLEDYQKQGDLAQLEALFTKVEKTLQGLTLPQGFESHWQAFLKDKKVKEALGHDLREVNNLSVKIDAAAKTGDIKSARSFLKKAQELLTALKDEEPPKIQILSTKEQNGLITIEGYASDNTKIKSVSVNHSLVPLDQDGKFSFKTVPTQSLKELAVRAEDVRGNVSAPVVVKIEGTYNAEAVKGKVSNAAITYAEDALTVKGKFVAGGKVQVGDIITFCDSQGDFTVMIDPRKTKVGATITVTGFDNGSATGSSVDLTIEDRWAPEITITKLTFNDNFVPALKTQPLEYKEKSVSVRGQVDLKQMVNVEGKVIDIGGTMESLEVGGRAVDTAENGTFYASMVADPSDSDLSVGVVAKDKAGNVSQKDVALDVFWKIPRVTINTEKVFLSSTGAFDKELIIQKEIDDIVVVLANAKGETVISKRLPLADVWPPELEIQDIRYEDDQVMIIGRTSSDATVSDINKVLFKESVEVFKNVSFTLSARYPVQDRELILVATNIEGKTSEEVKLTIGPPKDQKAPVLYIASPEFNKKKVLVKGFVEDDSKIKSLTIQGTAVEPSKRGYFSHELDSRDLVSVEIIATDTLGNKTKEIIALKDKEAPEIVINTWEVKNGRLVIAGQVNDNIAVKEVRLNNMPIAQGNDTQLTFNYDGALTESSKDAVIVAVDLLNNEAKEGPRKLEIPVDTSAPTGEATSMRYGSPIIYTTGKINDPTGIKAVYVNGEEVEFYDDGTYSIKIAIDVSPPTIELESPSYDNGKVAINGKVAVGDFNPARIVVESEDLSGNRGIVFTRDVAPYALDEIEVVINGTVIDVGDNGNIRHEQPIVLGERVIAIEVLDPFDNGIFQDVELENNPPLINANDLQYNSDNGSVTLTGNAKDDDSGLYSIMVNGVRVAFNEADGSFTYTGTFDQGSLSVVATDSIGNVASTTKSVNPPDIWPPVFALNVTPIPSVIGNPVYVEITSLDSRTRLPEILGGAPSVTANFNGSTQPLDVQGEGVNYIATLDTTGLDPVLVTVQVEGADEAGNRSSEMEGTNVFALVEEDSISPSFSFELVPSPIELGEASTINVFASESLKEAPTLSATLPSGTVNNLELTSVGGGEYESSLTVDVEEGLGDVLLRLNGGEDLSGNTHDTTEETFGVIAPVAETGLSLNIHSIEFLSNQFTISGQTASEAVVQMEVGEFLQNIIADATGLFTFERQVSISELEELHGLGTSIRVSLKAHNYAGFESPSQTFEVPLPPIPEQGGDNFAIQLQPVPVGQGDLLNINVEVLNTLADPPRGLLYLPDGARVLINLQGQGTLNAQYTVPEDAALGSAVFEVVAGNIREGVDFDIVLSTEWMQRLNKNEFYNIHASPDPLLVGNEAFFVVETLGDLDQVPQMQIILPDGQSVNVPLQGSGRRFEGRYQSQANTLPGRAELVLNPGTPEEIRRPYGIEEQTSGDDEIDIFLFANPNPLFGGEPYDVNVSLSQKIDFVPRLILRLRDGRGIDIPLNGSLPSNKFDANGTLRKDVGTGLARFVLLDDQGLVMDRFPAHVSAPLTASAGLDIFVIPDIVHHMDTATIQLNSISPLSGAIEAHIDYPNGSKEIFPLAGDDYVRQVVFTVPDYVPTGVVTITLFDNRGNSLGSTRAQVVEEDHEGGLVEIFLDNPDFGPSQNVRMSVEASWPLNFTPRGSLIWDGGSINIPLRGRIPGNRFRGQFRSPAEPLEGAKIEIKDNQDAVIGEFYLDRGPAQGEGDVIITPMPPVIGEPLSVRVIAPTIVDSAPTIRLIFEGAGPIELNAYGAIPGDTFTASLSQLEDPLTMVEIIHEGNVVASIPVDHLTMRDLEFFVEPVGDLAPCALADINVRADGFIPFMPQVSVDFGGLIVEMPLSQMSPSEFLGRLAIPCEASLDNINVRVYDPQGQLLWQRMYSQSDEGQGLYLSVMPSGDTDIQLNWDLLRGIDEHEIRWGKTAAMGERIINRGVNNGYFLSGLDSGEIYFFQVAALRNGREMMASDIVSATVGATMRELHVYEYINGTEVQLVWTEYPGATEYRVGWGTAPGAFTDDFGLAELNFSVPGLVIGNIYYMKVFALDGTEVIGESREIFVQLQAFQSAGGDVFVTPDPPVQGQDLVISIRSFDDLTFIPNIVVHLQDGSVEVIESGFGRDFTATLPGNAFTSPINAIDVYDANGAHMFGRPFTGGPGGGPGGGLPIIVNPDPPVPGLDLTIRAEFPGPAGFMPALFVEFEGEDVRQYAFPQLASDSIFEMTISGGVITGPVVKIWVEGPGGVYLGVRDFQGGPGGGPGPHLPNVYPDPPIIGQAFTVELNVGEIVNQAPLLRVFLEGGGVQEVNMVGTLPGQFFTYTVPTLNTMVTSIDFINPVTQTVEHTWFPGSSGPQSCDIIILSEDPPVFGLPLDVRVVFPQPMTFVPTLFVEFENGPRTYPFPQAAGLYAYEMALPIAEMNSQVVRVEIRDDLGNPLCDRGFFGGSEFFVTTLTVNPDPPTIGQALQIHLEFNAPVPFTPKWRLFTTGGPIEGEFPQGPGLSVYDYTVPAAQITLYPTDLEITTDNNIDIPGGELFFVNPADFSCTLDVDPFPPVPFNSLTVTVNYETGSFPAYIPSASMEFEGGGGYQQQFTQPAGVGFYQMTIAAGNITDNISILGIGDATTGGIDCGIDFEDAQGGVDIIIDLNPPVVGQPLTVTADFLHPPPFIPRLILEFYGKPDKVYIFPGNPGNLSYQFAVPVGDMTHAVSRIAIEDDLGNWIPDDLLFPPPAALDYPHNLFTQTTGVSGEIKIFWDVVSGAAGYKVYYGLSSQNYTESGSPIDVQDSSATQQIISGLTDSNQYFITVEAYDSQNNESNNPEEVAAFPGTGGGALVSAPAVINKSASEGTGISPQVLSITNNGTTAANVRFNTPFPPLIKAGGTTIPGSNYTITPAGATNIAASGNANFTVNLSIPSGQAAGNYTGDIKFYDDDNSNAAFDTGEAFVEVDVNVTVTGGGSGTFTADPPSFFEEVSQGGSLPTTPVNITNGGGSSVKIRFDTFALNRDGGGGSIPPGQYSITPSFVQTAASAQGPFTVNLNIPAATPPGDYTGPIKFYGDSNDNGSLDGTEDFVDVVVSLDVNVSIDHIHLTSNTNSSTMGDPIFVTLQAHNSGHTKVSGFDGSVIISVGEATAGEIPGSWHLSTNDGPRGPQHSTVAMFSGLGALTVDALEPETLQIDVINYTAQGGPLNLDFGPTAGSTATSFAIIAPANVPTSATIGAPVWVAAIDASGQVATGYTGTVDFDLGSSAALFVVNSQNTLSHAFAAADNGQITLDIRNNTAETVTLTADENPGSLINSAMFDFVGVSKYLVFGTNQVGNQYSEQGTAMKFTLRAADSSNNIVRSYNKSANFTRLSDPTSDAFLSNGSVVQFTDGIAEIILNNNQAPEDVTFIVEEIGDPAIETPTVTAKFLSTDSSAPEIVRVEMDTPWIVHIYFDEDVDSVTAGNESNYTGAGTVDKVCWYGDNVTLNLAAIPGSGLGTTFNLTVNNVEDTTGNAMSNVNFNNILIPNVDFQGVAGPTNDWFEIQASNTSPAVGETVLVTVYHKNVCGYLTGSNNENKNTNVTSASLTYGGSGGAGAIDNEPSSVDVSSGRAEFEITIASGSAGQSVTISASGSGVTTTTILTLSIP